MKNRKTIKIAGYITLLLLLANETVFYLTNTPKEFNPLFLMFLVLNTIIAAFLFLFSMLISSGNSESQIIEGYDKNIQDQQVLEFELKRIEEQKRHVEEQRQLIRSKDIDEKANEIVDNLIGKNSLQEYADQLLVNLAKKFGVVQGLFFIKGETDVFTLVGSYAFYSEQGMVDFELGEGLAGQVAKNKKLLNISNVPDGYITILSGIGKGQASHLLIFPVIHNNKTIAIIELASFSLIDSLGEDIIVEVSHRVSDELSKRFSIV